MEVIRTGKANRARDLALVMHACNSCGHYPIEVLEAAGEGFEPTCPKCHGKTHFEKVYRADYYGRVTE